MPAKVSVVSRVEGASSPLEIGEYELDDELWQATAADGTARIRVYLPTFKFVLDNSTTSWRCWLFSLGQASAIEIS